MPGYGYEGWKGKNVCEGVEGCGRVAFFKKPFVVWHIVTKRKNDANVLYGIRA